MSNLNTCSLSGQPFTPTSTIVITPSGHACERRLLLSKLSENGGIDPFTTESPLKESQLIELQNHNAKVVPPKPPSATCFSSLLNMMQNEVDGLVLELFDTRKALEETRKELSQALYQNDAALRVIARLAMERDAAREQIASFSRQEENRQPVPQAELESKKRKLEETIVDDNTRVEESQIPDEDLQTMVATWKVLSKARRKRNLDNCVTINDLQTFTELDSKSYHKSSNPTVTCMAVCGDLVVTGGTDKTAIVYDSKSQSIVATLASATKEISGVAIHRSNDDQTTLVVTASLDGNARIYTSPNYSLRNTLSLGQHHPLVGIAIQPTGRYILPTSSRQIAFCSHDQIVKTFSCPDNDDEYTCSGIHPDGLIYAAGTKRGTVAVWDLKTQSLAQTLNTSDDDEPSSEVTQVAFSENGYHFAVSTLNNIYIWDLRKLKRIVTIDCDDRVNCVGFDPSGKFLAYGGKAGMKIVVVKDWKKIVTSWEGGSVRSMAWGHEGKWMVMAGEERGVKFWGVKTEREDVDVEMEQHKEDKADDGKGDNTTEGNEKEEEHTEGEVKKEEMTKEEDTKDNAKKDAE